MCRDPIWVSTAASLLACILVSQVFPSARAEPSNYLILSMARSGSSHLCAVLRRNRLSECYAEPLREDEFERTKQFLQQQSQGDVQLTPEQFSDLFFSQQLCDKLNVCHFGYRARTCEKQECDRLKKMATGYKVFYYHNGTKETLMLAKKYNVKVIHLVRASAFRRQVSHLVAQATHYYGVSRNDKDMKQPKRPVVVDIDEMHREIQAHKDSFQLWDKFLKQNNIPHKTVFYEELRMREVFLSPEDVFCDIFEYLGLPCHSNSAIEKTRDIEASTRYYGHITNIEEVSNAFPFETCELRYGSMYQ